jgi:hypothetical protein
MLKIPAEAANQMMSKTLAFARTSPPDVGLNKFLAEIQTVGWEFGGRSTGKDWAATLVWRVDNEAHQLEVGRRVFEGGAQSTPVIDRFWF